MHGNAPNMLNASLRTRRYPMYVPFLSCSTGVCFVVSVNEQARSRPRSSWILTSRNCMACALYMYVCLPSFARLSRSTEYESLILCMCRWLSVVDKVIYIALAEV